MKIKGAIFDMDGILLDSMLIWHTLDSRYIDSLAVPVEDGLEEKLRVMGYPKNQEYIKEHYCPEKTLEEIDDGMLQCMANFYRNEVEPLPYVKELLEELKSRGVKMCIASATPKWMCKIGLKRAGIDGYFSEIFDVPGVGKNKNYPDIFEKALAYLGTAKEETPVFEDAYYSIKTCKAADFPVIAIRDKTEPKQEEIKNLADLYLLSYAEREKIFAE